MDVRHSNNLTYNMFFRPQDNDRNMSLASMLRHDDNFSFHDKVLNTQSCLPTFPYRPVKHEPLCCKNVAQKRINMIGTIRRLENRKNIFQFLFAVSRRGGINQRGKRAPRGPERLHISGKTTVPCRPGSPLAIKTLPAPRHTCPGTAAQYLYWLFPSSCPHWR